MRRHQAVRRRSSVHWHPACGQVNHDLVGLTVYVLGDMSVRSHQSVLTDLLDYISDEELSQSLSTAELCSFGISHGLARASNCVAAVATSHPALRLNKTLVDSFLRTLEAVRPGTEVCP